MNQKLAFRKLHKADWAKVSEIYQDGLDTGDASFETKAPNWNYWNDAHLKECRLIAEIDNEIIGWAALSPVSSRQVYSGVAEVSVYVSPKFSGQKIGTKLLERLVLESEENGIWTLQASIFPENVASIVIHESVGFRKVGYREKIGEINGVWRDTILVERRSKKVGVE